MLVKELLAKLQDYPGNVRVLIHDADTGWFLEILDVHVSLSGNVLIGGNYSHMDDEESE